MKIVIVEEENLYENLLNNLMNFNEIFRKNMIYENIKSHQKAGLDPLFRKYIFGKTNFRTYY